MSKINLNIQIENIPEPIEYYNRAYELFIESFEDISDLLYIQFNGKEKNEQDILLQRKKAINITTKLHHISEIYLSYLIAKNDVLKLINIELGNTIIDFDDCHTIQANKLLDLAKSQVGESFFKSLFNNFSFEKNYNLNRKIRNKNMHSLVRNFNVDLNIIVKNFLTLWYIFFKKKSFVLDFYKIILKNNFILENYDMNIGVVFEDLDKEPFFKNFNFKIIKRKLLFRIVYYFSNVLNKQDFKTLFEIQETKKEPCFCPNCESISRTQFSEGYIDYDYDYKFSYQPKTLYIDQYGKKGFCLLCGFCVETENSFKQYCNCCNKNTFFVKHKLKGAIFFEDYDDNDINNYSDYILLFCLYCGSCNQK